MSPTRVTLPLDVLARAVEREQVGTLHLTLRPEPLWLPSDERDAAQAALDEALAEAGLLDRRGRLDPEFLDWLPLLTNAAIEYFGWVFEGETTWSLLAAARGLQGVLAVCEGETVLLESADHTDLARTVVHRLPEIGPGGGSHWSVRAEDFEAVARGHTPDRAAAATAREILKVTERPVLGGGELYVAERDEHGHYRRLESPLHYVDTDWGRYLNHRVETDDGTVLHVAPATAGTLASTLESLRGSVALVQRA
ncbi:ESX secretion-associated protein EspG [Saccharomonospora saliphila]|uniref:ESX secretion-associated protein EspG n=1 Tax=Saccharomonospora saliphila TaxID=369829 RepID=UPI0003660D43|nr:ESX secretion-associated protein EspG [Saccharomonospora saliphila]